jgi:carboxypeptidase C (cathepsin A)
MIRFASCFLVLHFVSLLLSSCVALPVVATPWEGGERSLTAGAEADLITSLPGLPEGVSFRQFSGYITVHSGRSLFYWFVESSSANSPSDPVVLWTNGGPGCSGLTGFLSEQGPFRAVKRKNGKEAVLELNAYAWNKVANMIFIEQPAGVGFSTAAGAIHYGDEQSATDNAAFVEGWLARFPQYKANPFYLTSESYGGHYLPTLAVKLKAKPGINFKGFAVGNPLTWMPFRDFGQYATYAAHQLLPAPLWNDFLDAGCKNDISKAQCQSMLDTFDGLTADIDPYALDFPICRTSASTAHALLRKLHHARGRVGGYFPTRYKPCEDYYMIAYLNRKDVQSAIHIATPGTIDWTPCNDQINSDYNVTDVTAPMMHVYDELINGGGLKILVYSGDDDSICSTIGTQMWVWDLPANKGGGQIDRWRPWKTMGQVAGYTVAWKGMRFATVHGAGHMVPATRPQQALNLFKKFLHDGWKGDD